MLDFAVKRANQIILFESDIQLAAISERVEYGNEIEASEKVCQHLKVRVPNALWSWMRIVNWNTQANKIVPLFLSISM